MYQGIMILKLLRSDFLLFGYQRKDNTVLPHIQWHASITRISMANAGWSKKCYHTSKVQDKFRKAALLELLECWCLG